MAGFMTAEELLGQGGSASKGSVPSSSFIPAEQLLGIPSEPPSVMGFLRDPEEQAKFFKSLGDKVYSVGTFLGALPGMGAGAVAGALRTTEELIKGAPAKAAYREGLGTYSRVAEHSNPVKLVGDTLYKLLGKEPSPTELDAAMSALDAGIIKYSDVVQAQYGAPSEGTELLLKTVMGAGAGRGTVGAAGKLGKTLGGKQAPPSTSPLAVRLGTNLGKKPATRTPEAEIKAPLAETEIAPESPVPIVASVAEAVAASKARIAEQKAKEAEASLGPGVWTSSGIDYPVTIVGAPERALNAQGKAKGPSYTPVEYNGQRTYVLTKELRATGKGPVEFEPGKMLLEEPSAAPRPEMPGLDFPTRMSELEAQIAHREAMSPKALEELDSAVAKLRGGRTFDMTATEKIALDRSLKVKGGQLVDSEGRPFEKGVADPELLVKILGAGGVAAYVAANPEEAEKVAYLAGAALAIKGKGGNWHPETVKKLSEPLQASLVEHNFPVTEQGSAANAMRAAQADRMVTGWLQKHAGTATDPIKDLKLPDGQTLESVTDIVIKGTSFNSMETYARNGTKPVSGKSGYLERAPEGTKEGETVWDIVDDWKPGQMENQSALSNLQSYMSHIGDYLRMNVKPEDLPKYDLVRAARESAANDARVAKAMEKAAQASMKDLPVYKDFGDGMKWVELKLPERLTPEQAKGVRKVTEAEMLEDLPDGRDSFLGGKVPEYAAVDAQGKIIKNNYTEIPAGGRTPEEAWLAGRLAEEGNCMGHCVGGYVDNVASGETRILSLRDKKGESHVTVELEINPQADPQANPWEAADVPAHNILQIKGKQNKAPVEAYQPYVQDLVKSGEWGEVGDLHNTGLQYHPGGLVEIFGRKMPVELPRGYYTPDDFVKQFHTKLEQQQRGSADPKLLAAIAAGTAAGAYLLSNPDDSKGLAALGFGTVAATRGKFKGMELADVVKAAQATRSEGAFAEIYRQTEPMLRKSKEMREAESKGYDAEGIIQTTFEKAFKNIDSFSGDSKFSTWLYTVMKNTMLDEARAKAVRPGEAEMTPEVMEVAGHFETPERALRSKELGTQIESALERLDPEIRETFLMQEVQGLTNKEIATELGIPEATVNSRVFRARTQLQKHLREYAPDFKQRGGATPEQLVGLAGVAGGAALAAAMDPEHGVRNGIYGALAGGVLATTGGRAALKAAIKSPDVALGAISTRLANMDPALRFQLLGHERRVLQRIDRLNDQVLPFVQALQKLPEGIAAQIDNALRNGNTEMVLSIPELRVTYPAVQAALKGLEGELQGLGRFQEGVTNYFPRIVKDLEGLKAAMGAELRVGLEARLAEANAKSIRAKGRALTDVEESVLVNNYLYAPNQTSFQPGWSKGRKLQEIPPEFQQFYENSTESLLRYVSGAATDIEVAKFFGRDLQSKGKGGKVFNDLDSSIGNLTARLLREGKIDQKQAMELRGILKARFEQGNKAMSAPLAALRNVTNLALLGNVASAATQLGDSAMVIAHHGFVPTLQALTEQLVGKSRVTPKDLGLINHVAEELSEMGPTGRALHIGMKLSGFHAIDMFAKQLNVNAALKKAERQLATPKGEAAFRAKYFDAFGPEIDAVIADIRQGRKSDAVEQYTFAELSDTQPISKAEMPEAYLNNPNGRILYQLKTYMIKQADVVRRKAYQEIAKGTPEGIVTGAKNLSVLATAYALSNVPGDAIKDWLAGRPVELLSTPKLVENVAQTFGINRYTADRLRQGQVANVVTGMMTPPVRVLEDLGKLNAKSVSYVPLVGRPIYERYLGGNERREIAEKIIANRGAPKSERQKLSPEAKEYLRQKRMERKAKELAK